MQGLPRRRQGQLAALGSGDCLQELGGIAQLMQQVPLGPQRGVGRWRHAPDLHGLDDNLQFSRLLIRKAVGKSTRRRPVRNADWFPPSPPPLSRGGEGRTPRKNGEDDRPGLDEVASSQLHPGHDNRQSRPAAARRPLKGAGGYVGRLCTVRRLMPRVRVGLPRPGP